MPRYDIGDLLKMGSMASLLVKNVGGKKYKNGREKASGTGVN